VGARVRHRHAAGFVRRRQRALAIDARPGRWRRRRSRSSLPDARWTASWSIPAR